MQYLRRLSVLSLSTLLILGAIHYGSDILTLLITPLPKNLQSCIKDKISTEVNAQAICTGTTNDTFSVWTQNGKLQDSTIFYTATAPDATLTNLTQGITQSGIRIQSTYSAGTYVPGLFWSTSDNNADKPKAGIWLFQDGTGTDMILGTSKNYATGVTNTGITINQDGNITLGGTTALGDSRISVTSTNSDNDAQFTARKASGTALSFLAWDTVAHISAGTYYSGSGATGAWTHANGNTYSQIMRFNPGSGATNGVDWLTSSNSSSTFTTPVQLWNMAGQWKAGINTGGATFTGTTAGNGNSVFDGRIWSANNFIHLSPPNGYSVVIDTGNRTAGGPSGGVAHLSASGSITAGQNFIIGGLGNGLTSTLNGGTNILTNTNTYGSWRITGSKGGYYGLSFDTAAGPTSLMMGTTGQVWGQQVTGMYNQTEGKWLWYVQHRNMFAEAYFDLGNSTYYLDPGATSNLYIATVAQINSPGASGITFSTSGITGFGGSQVHLSNGQTNGVRVGNGTVANLSATGTITGSNISDIRLKTNIHPVENGLALVDKIKPVTFDWKDPSQYEEIEGEDANRTYFGFIAQQLEEVFPQWIMTNNHGWKVMRDSPYVRNEMFAILFKAVQELSAKLQTITTNMKVFESTQDTQAEMLQKQQKLIELQDKRIAELEEKINTLEPN